MTQSYFESSRLMPPRRGHNEIISISAEALPGNGRQFPALLSVRGRSTLSCASGWGTTSHIAPFSPEARSNRRYVPKSGGGSKTGLLRNRNFGHASTIHSH
jgi:hypothetical protein